MRRREQYARRKLRRGHGGERRDEDKSGHGGPRGRRIAASASGEHGSSGGRHTQRLTGRLSVQRSGVGFVVPDSGRGGDIFVHASSFGEAWHGDRVEVALLPRHGRSREGVVTAVLKRGRATITAEIMRAYGKNAWLSRPLDSRLDFALLAKFGAEDRGGGTKRSTAPYLCCPHP